MQDMMKAVARPCTPTVRRLGAAVVAVALAGCATVERPQDAAMTIDAAIVFVIFIGVFFQNFLQFFGENI